MYARVDSTVYVGCGVCVCTCMWCVVCVCVRVCTVVCLGVWVCDGVV